MKDLKSFPYQNKRFVISAHINIKDAKVEKWNMYARPHEDYVHNKRSLYNRITKVQQLGNGKLLKQLDGLKQTLQLYLVKFCSCLFGFWSEWYFVNSTPKQGLKH